tara:strand:+ start:904 stop:1425 length:522 start_codon:yes stop_codon:yes gene_type:complete
MGYQLIETIEVGSGGVDSIEFTGIASDLGQDLKVVISARINTSGGEAMSYEILINGDTGFNYNFTTLMGSGSVASSAKQLGYPHLESRTLNGDGTTALTFSSSELYISNYASSTAKSMSMDGVTENNAAAAYQQLAAMSWSGTAAVTSIKFDKGGPNLFAEFTTASIYTITAD